MAQRLFVKRRNQLNQVFCMQLYVRFYYIFIDFTFCVFFFCFYFSGFQRFYEYPVHIFLDSDQEFQRF